MNDKLKKVIELANQLQEAVDECENKVLSVTIRPYNHDSATGVHIYKPNPGEFDGMEFDGQDKYGNRWFKSLFYGVRVYGAVIGGDDQ